MFLRGAVVLPPSAAPPASLPQSLPPAEALSLFAEPTEPPAPLVTAIARAAGTGGAGFFLFLLFAELVVLLAFVPVGLAYIADATGGVIPLFVALPIPVAFAFLDGSAASAWYIGLVVAITASAGFFLFQHLPGAARIFMRVFEGRGVPRLHEPNGVFELSRLLATSFVFSVAVALIADLFGATPRVPTQIEEEPFGAMLVLFANAAVYEELITRVLLLGIPLLIVHAFGRGRAAAPIWRYFLGGNFKLDGPSCALVVFQAGVFGAAHVPGWDLWKLPGAFFTGLLLGYVFLRLGLHACIVFHFMTDYLVPLLAVPSSAAFPGLVSWGVIAFIGLGVVGIGRYFFIIAEWRRSGELPPGVFAPRPPPAVPAPPLAPPSAPTLAPPSPPEPPS